MHQDVPNDPQAAAAILAELAAKDADETICRYPTCHAQREARKESGRPSAYCNNPEHTAISNHRARRRLEALAAQATTEAPKPTPLSSMSQTESLRQSVLLSVTQLQTHLERYVTTLTSMTDPDIALAHLQAAQAQAESRIAEIQQNLSMERSLRLAAETDRQNAIQQAQSAQEAAELAIERMEAVEATMQQVQAESAQRITQIQEEMAQRIADIQAEAQRQQEAVQQQASERIAQAQAQEAQARAEANDAVLRAHDAETRAHSQIETAERLAAEARAALAREQTEVDRLREELARTHTRAEADRTEARASLTREQAEVDRLRQEVQATRTRADQLEIALQELRAQLEQLQRTHTEQP